MIITCKLLSRVRRLRTFVLVGAVGAVLAATLDGATRERPLLRDFIGINSYAEGHSPHKGFDPDLYRPVARLLREYHRVERDLGDTPSVPAPFPRARDGTDWSSVYAAWNARGWRIDSCLQFESVKREHWKDIEQEAWNYGHDFARTFGPSSRQPQVEVMEIGNEPTWSDEDYSLMVRSMAEGLRAGDPGLRIGTSNITVGPSGRWDKSVDCITPFAGLIDILTLHIYAEIAQDPTWQRSYPEDARVLRYLNDVEALCAWRDRQMPGKEVWITEFGYDSSTKPANPTGRFPQWIGVTDEQQAQWIVRSILLFASMPVERAYLYFFNDRDVPSLHASAGVTRNFQPKPSFHALAHLQSTLGDYRFSRVVRNDPENLRVHEFVRGEAPHDPIWAVWSPTGKGAKHTEVLSVIPGKLTRFERMPLQKRPITEPEQAVQLRSDGTLEVQVDENPLYLHFRLPAGKDAASPK